jgi:hypothetical protein
MQEGRRPGKQHRKRSSCLPFLLPSVRQASPDEEVEDVLNFETSCWCPAGTQSRPARLGRQQVASLARCPVRSCVKRRQRATGPCNSASKVIYLGAELVEDGEGNRGTLHWPGVSPPAGSKSTAREQGAPREPERPCRVRDLQPVGEPGDHPQPHDYAFADVGRQERADAGGNPREQGQPKPKGTPGRESECLVVPEKQGNPPEETLWREGGIGSWNRWRER